jgi:hypothetical protein
MTAPLTTAWNSSSLETPKPSKESRRGSDVRRLFYPAVVSVCEVGK